MGEHNRRCDQNLQKEFKTLQWLYSAYYLVFKNTAENINYSNYLVLKMDYMCYIII